MSYHIVWSVVSSHGIWCHHQIMRSFRVCGQLLSMPQASILGVRERLAEDFLASIVQVAGSSCARGRGGCSLRDGEFGVETKQACATAATAREYRGAR